MDVVLNGTLIENNGEVMFKANMFFEPLHIDAELPYGPGTEQCIGGIMTVDGNEETLVPDRRWSAQ